MLRRHTRFAGGTTYGVTGVRNACHGHSVHCTEWHDVELMG